MARAIVGEFQKYASDDSMDYRLSVSCIALPRSNDRTRDIDRLQHCGVILGFPEARDYWLPWASNLAPSVTPLNQHHDISRNDMNR